MADEAVQTAPSTEVAPQQSEEPSTNMMSPMGDLVSLPNSQLEAALHPSNGYRLATPADETKYFNEQKYGGAAGMAHAAANAAIKTATFGIKSGTGTPEEIKGYEEENPVSDIAGSILPYAAEQLIPGANVAANARMLSKAHQAISRIPGVGEAASALSAVPRAITAAGEAITNATGLTGVGAKALQYAAEGAIMQGGNEVSKMLLKDPSSSVPNALANEGMAALLGGALGATAGGIGKAADLWEAKFGAKASDAVLGTGLKDADQYAMQSGIAVPESLKAAMTGDLDAANRVQILAKTPGYAGNLQRKDLAHIYDESQAKTMEALQASPRMLEKAPNEYSIGSALQDDIKANTKAVQQTYGPLYDELRPVYKGITVNAPQKEEFAAKLTSALSDAGLGALKGSPETAAIKNLYGSLDDVTSAEGIKNLGTALNNAAKNPELQRLAAVAGPIIKDFESTVVQAHLGETDPTGILLNKRKAADAAYKQHMNTLGDLGQTLGLGRFKGPNGFLRALDEKPPEQILKRLSATNRKDMVELLQSRIPEAAEKLKDYHIHSQLYDAVKPDKTLNTKKFLNNMFDGTSNPEHIQSLMTGNDPIAAARLNAVKDGLNSLPGDGNPSNSASMVMKLLGQKLGALLGAVTGVGGMGHIGGAALGGIADKIWSEVSPFLSYKILEMRAAGKNIVPGDVKALFDYAKSVAEGHAAVSKAVNGIFNHSSILSPSMVPKESDRKKLNEYAAQVRKNPNALINTAKGLQGVMPDHAPLLALTATQAANYLNSIKPRQTPSSPLDSKIPISTSQMSEYNRQVDIVQQPLMGLKHLQDGTLTPQDMQTLQTCHSGLCDQVRQQIMERISDPKTIVPYRTRLGLSLFMGQPLDSTMSPSSIVAAQPLPSNGGMPPSSAPQQGPKRSATALNKLPGQYRTSAQTAEEDRSQGRRD